MNEVTLQVGVKVLIRNQANQYLFLKRSNGLSDDMVEAMWDIPGGRINSDEKLDEALKREVLEETGLKLGTSMRLLKAQDIFVKNKDSHVVRITYETNIINQKVHLSSEHDAFQWLSIDDALGLNLDPYIAEILIAKRRIPASELKIPGMELGTYRHYKGDLYEAIGIALHTETHEPAVIYRPLYDSLVAFWSRPYTVWKETIIVDGHEVPRFKKVSNRA